MNFERTRILDDGADEPFDCVNVTCPDEYFKCPLSGKCIPYEKVCDNVEDCPTIDKVNGTTADETLQACSMNEFLIYSDYKLCFLYRFCVKSDV